jgi:hypothetical protein
LALAAWFGGERRGTDDQAVDLVAQHAAGASPVEGVRRPSMVPEPQGLALQALTGATPFVGATLAWRRAAQTRGD